MIKSSKSQKGLIYHSLMLMHERSFCFRTEWVVTGTWDARSNRTGLDTGLDKKKLHSSSNSHFSF